MTMAEPGCRRMAPGIGQVPDSTRLSVRAHVGTGLDTSRGMKDDSTRLVRHLILAVLVKLALLAGLWWFFVRDLGVPVDPGAAAAHLVTPADGAPR